MVSALNLVKDETPEAILKSVHRAVDAYVGGAPQFDDLTMLCLQYNGRTDEITLPAVFDSIGRLIVYVGHRIKPFRPTERTVSQIEIAIDEIFSNIARYAYPKKKGKATVRVETIGRTLVLTFMDSGIPYDPTAKSDPDTSLPVEERPIGGVGIFLVKKMMDAVEYRYEDGHNILTLKKTL